MLDMNTKAMVNLEIMNEEKPQVLRWNPKKMTILAIGYKSGNISFIDINTLKTCTLEK
jgi:hypothetical protein